MKVYVRNEDLANYPNDLSDEKVKLFAKEILNHFKHSLKRIIPDVSIIFVSRAKIQSMNKRYRGIDEPTDVLSFQSEEDGYLGDIIISKEIVAHFAREFSCPYTEELQRDIIHGIMHLLGYDHTGELREGSQEEMFIIQETIIQDAI